MFMIRSLLFAFSAEKCCHPVTVYPQAPCYFWQIQYHYIQIGMQSNWPKPIFADDQIAKTSSLWLTARLFFPIAYYTFTGMSYA